MQTWRDGDRFVTVRKSWFGWRVEAHDAYPRFFFRQARANREFQMLTKLYEYVAAAMTGKRSQKPN